MLLPKLCYRIAEVEAETARSFRHNSSKANVMSVHGHTDCIHKTAWKSTLAMDCVPRDMGPGTPSGFSDNVDVVHSGARLNPMHNDINSILYTVGYSLFYLVTNLVNRQTIFTATSQSQGTTPLFAPSLPCKLVAMLAALRVINNIELLRILLQCIATA
jgi:hypothetical protein